MLDCKIIGVILFLLLAAKNISISQDIVPLESLKEEMQKRAEQENRYYYKFDSTRPYPIIRDMYSFKYKFLKGDTLIYTAMSNDSIIIDYSSPLLRIRFERYMITCDSITKDGHFALTQQLIEFKSKESFESERNVTRSTTPWLNIPVSIIMDTLGRRINTFYPEKEITAAITPGGAFQPFILLPLDSISANNEKLTQETWLATGRMDIPENGIPVPLIRYTLYYRMFGMTDTLDFKGLLKIGLSMTLVGTLVVNNDDVSMHTETTSNAAGAVFWDTINWVPKFYHQTMEQKLKIKEGDYFTEAFTPGFHYINTTFVLDKFIRKEQQ